jgi:GTP-binding protein
MSRLRASFVISAAEPAGFPVATLPEVAVVGRSNVGKSSLINAMTGQDGLARTSRTPGRTRLLNWFRVESHGNAMHLVDLPGYGFAEVNRDLRASWQPLIEAYLSERATLKAVLLLIDLRRGPEAEELDFVPWLEARGIPMIVAMTKCDKLPKNQRTMAVLAAKKQMSLRRDPFAVSVQTGDNVEATWRAIAAAALPKPRG